MGHEGGAGPPVETPRSVLDRLEWARSRTRHRGSSSDMRPRRRQFSMASRSIASDPEEISSHIGGIRPQPIPEEAHSPSMNEDGFPQATDADGDDELVTNDDEDKADQSSELPQARGYDKGIELASGMRLDRISDDDDDEYEEDYFQTPKATTFAQRPFSSSTPFANRSRAAKSTVNLSAALASSPPVLLSPKPRIRAHNRNRSTNTILYSPIHKKIKPSPTSSPHSISPPHRRAFISHHQHLLHQADDLMAIADHGDSTGRKTPRRMGGQATPRQQQQQQQQQQRQQQYRPTRAIPIPRQQNVGTILGLENTPHRYERPSLSARALDLASDLGDNRHGPDPGSAAILLPASLATEMGFVERRAAAAAAATVNANANANASASAANVAAAANAVAGRDDVSRKVLARIGNLEKSFRDIVKEVKDWRKEGGGFGGSTGTGSGNASRVASDGENEDGEGKGGNNRGLGGMRRKSAAKVRVKYKDGKGAKRGDDGAGAGAEPSRPASDHQEDKQFQHSDTAGNAALASSSL